MATLSKLMISVQQSKHISIDSLSVHLKLIGFIAGAFQLIYGWETSSLMQHHKLLAHCGHKKPVHQILVKNFGFLKNPDRKKQ